MYQFGKIEQQRQWPSARQSPAATVYRTLKNCVSSIEKRWRTTDYYRFERGAIGHDTLVCALIGKKPELWPYTLPLLEAAMADNDVCLSSPGVYSKFLSDYCKARDWSYLSTATNDASLAQNIAYKLHPKAELILKVEEDCFLPRSIVSNLVARFYAVEKDIGYEPGILAPLVPIDPYALSIILELLGLQNEFKRAFGDDELRRAKTISENDAEIVKWIWEHTAPLEENAKRLARTSTENLSFAPVRYNTGLIAFRRGFWEAGGYLPVFRRRLMIGRDTSNIDQCHFCSEAMAQSRPVVIASDLMVGRFCFDNQYETMLSYLDERPELFAAPAVPA